MKTFSVQPEALKAITKTFLAHFADQPAEVVLYGLRVWEKTNREFPTVSDIYDIIGKNPYEEGLDKDEYKRRVFRRMFGKTQYQEAYGNN